MSVIHPQMGQMIGLLGLIHGEARALRLVQARRPTRLADSESWRKMRHLMDRLDTLLATDGALDDIYLAATSRLEKEGCI